MGGEGVRVGLVRGTGLRFGVVCLVGCMLAVAARVICMLSFGLWLCAVMVLEGGGKVGFVGERVSEVLEHSPGFSE